MTSFAELGLAAPILKALETEGYIHPTPIQEQAIPYVLQGKDLQGIAQTRHGQDGRVRAADHSPFAGSQATTAPQGLPCARAVADA